MEKFKRKSQTDIYKGVRVHLVKDHLETPEGKLVDWELIKHVGAAAVIPVMEDGTILMVYQYRNASDSITLEIPAGTLDSPDEDPIECAYRELEEETGYKTEEMSFLYKFYSSIGICDEVIHIYVAKNLQPSQQNLDDDEFVEIERLELSTLVDMIFKGEIVDNKTISAILAYKTYLEQNK